MKKRIIRGADEKHAANMLEAFVRGRGKSRERDRGNGTRDGVGHEPIDLEERRAKRAESRERRRRESSPGSQRVLALRRRLASPLVARPFLSRPAGDQGDGLPGGH